MSWELIRSLVANIKNEAELLNYFADKMLPFISKSIHGRNPIFDILTQMTKITLRWLTGPSDIIPCSVLL